MSEEMTKSAKKRAAAKARAANAAPEAAPAPAPAPAPEPKAKAKAEAKAKPKADAKPKAEPKAEPKAKAKGEAKAKPEPKPEPKAEAKPAAKAAGKASSKKKAAPAPAPEPPKPKKEEENTSHLSMDDGTGADWEVATSTTKKNQRRQDRKADGSKMTKADLTIQEVNKSIPGMAAPSAVAVVGAAKASQSVTAKVDPAAKGAAADTAKAEEAPKENLDKLEVRVPEAKIGRVIGPKGANLKIIQEKTGIDRIDTNGEIFTISGKPGTTAGAHAALVELVEKGYMSLAFENFAEIGCMAHPSTFPDIIGSKGATIIKLKDELKVEINIPPVAKSANPGPKKYKIGIAGSKEASEKAQKCIEDIIMYGHSEITHPGWVHEELEVPAWAYAFIIGKGGSELRHIQKNWSVKVNIPREHSENSNVVVVGEPRDVARAKEYIEKQVSSAGEKSSGRDAADKADDYWGNDDQEPWMDQYMYKRK